MCDRKGCRKALEMFSQNFNCAESVLSGIAAELNIESNIIPKIASGFGGGVSRRGDLCGALSGAIMGLGLIHGRSTPDADAKVTMYNTASDLWAKFEAEYGTVNCKELTGCDMMTPEGAEEFAAKDMHNTLCHKFVLWCVEQVIADI